MENRKEFRFEETISINEELKEKRGVQLGQSQNKLGWPGSYNKDPARNPRACVRIAGSQMAWEGCAAIRTTLRAGAYSFANHSRTSYAKALAGSQLCSLRAAGAGSGGYSTPLRPHPRASRMPSQATSGWANVGAPSQARHFFLGASPGVARPNQPPLSSVAVERVTLD